MSRSSSFDRFDWAGSAEWQAIEQKLYFPNEAEKEKLLLKRKRKFYKANIDPNYEWEEAAASDSASASTSSTTSSSSDYTSSSRSSSSSSSTSNSNSSTPRASSAPPPTSPTKGRIDILLSYIQLITHTLTLVFTLLYLFPLTGLDEQTPSYYRVLKLSIISQLLTIFRTYGRPQVSKSYLQMIMLNDQTHFLMLAFLLYGGSTTPLLWAIAPFVSRSALFVARALTLLLPKISPALYSSLSGPLNAVTSRAAEISAGNATIEAITGLMLIVMLVTPSRNVLLLFIYWQYLRLRYMLSEESKRAFRSINSQLTQLTYHRLCPTIIRTLYMKGTTMMYNMVDPEQMAAAQQQAPKCTIM